MKKCYLLYSLGLGVICWQACLTSIPDDIQHTISSFTGEVDFNFDVKPILSDNCFKCHGPDEKQRKGDLRLDINPRALDHKDWINRLVSSDPDFMMPPPESHLVLSQQEKATLVKWIQDGAQMIFDRFIYKKLKQHQFTANPEASKQTLLKHAYFYLTGLPPPRKSLMLMRYSPSQNKCLVSQVVKMSQVTIKPKRTVQNKRCYSTSIRI